MNISNTILYDMEKSQNQVLEMINACVSHEMRNPLNSIIAHNIEKEHLYREIETLVHRLKTKMFTIDRFEIEIKAIFTKLKNGLRV